MEIIMLRNMSLLCREYEIHESNCICLCHLMPHFLHYLIYFDKFHIAEKIILRGERKVSNLL